MTLDGARTYMRKVQQSNGRYFLFGRADWMTDEQYRQLKDYCQGLQVPTDPEIINGLRFGTSRIGTRAAGWMFSHVSGTLVGNESFDSWCEVIREVNGDPDLYMDEGL